MSNNVHDILRQRLLQRAGLAEQPKPKYTLAQFERLTASQWSPRFEQLMRNRLAMGLLRYGPLGAKNKPYYNMVKSIISRAQAYLTDGNDERLVDIANLALVEFVEGKHPKKHFSALDSGPGCSTKITSSHE